MGAGRQGIESGAEQYRTLLEVAESIALNRDLPGLFHDLVGCLRRVAHFDFLSLILHEPARQAMRLHVLASSAPTDLQPGLEYPVDQGPSGWVFQNQESLLIPDVERETRYPAVMRLMREHGVRSTCLLPLTSAHRRLGVLAFGSQQPSEYADSLDFLKLVAAQVAVAVDNTLNYERAQSFQQQVARERDRLQAVLDITNGLVSNLDFRELLGTIAGSLRGVIAHDYLSLALYDREQRVLHLHAMDLQGGRGSIREELMGPAEGSPAGQAIASRRPLLLNRDELVSYSSEVTRRLLAEGMQASICVPLVRGERVLGTLNMASQRAGAFTREDLDLLGQIGNEVAIAVENAEAFRQIGELKDRLAKEKHYLEDEIRTEYDFEEIVGESAAWKRVLGDVATVAPTGSTVLLAGESGTGKELVARAIHHLSQRRERTFVKVNCAAIPTGLLESELFGHEKGAFTGAISQKVGRFEFANQGTLLLDEIGDIPLDLQPKLLRVLQEREFERLGGSRTLHVDVRLITSTNRDLAQMVAERAFRDDLYYRLNVFPVYLPPLRERREDIPLLVSYFTQKHARRMHKRIESIPAEVLDVLERWHWPGNVRELENFVERAVILSPGPVLAAPLAELEPGGPAPPRADPTTLEDLERAHIQRTLRETNWVIGGSKGAAVRLGMKRTTLQSRMQKLGIRRPRPA